MTLTPTDKGAMFAGIGVSLLAWLSLFKLDSLAKILHVNRWVKQDALFRRINDNKGVSILCTELFNYAVHGISSPDSVIFAIGSTLVNAVFIFIVLPVKLAKWNADSKIHVERAKQLV